MKRIFAFLCTLVLCLSFVAPAFASETGTQEGLGYVGLPAEYQQVQYLQSTGTQYINTGYSSPNLGFGFDCGFKADSSSGAFFGLMSQNYKLEPVILSVISFYKISLMSGVDIGDSGSSVLIQTPISFDSTTIYNYHEATYHGNLFTVDGMSATTGTDDSDLGYYELLAFASYSSNIAPQKSTIYYLKWYVGNSLVWDLVPCYRVSDNVPGFYDLQRHVFLTNSGTGDFIVGAEIQAPASVSYFNDMIELSSSVVSMVASAFVKPPLIYLVSLVIFSGIVVLFRRLTYK